MGSPYEAARNKVKPRAVVAYLLMRRFTKEKGGRNGRGEVLENTGLPLQPANILDNLVDVGRSNGFGLGHVAELPMMGFDAESRSALECGIAVVIGFIDFMD